MPPTLDPRTQRLHDLKGVHADFKSILRLLRSGYRFDDDEAPGVLVQLEKAVTLFEQEIRTLEREWSRRKSL